MFADRRSPAAFWLGALLTVIGVLLHMPMFVMARSMHYRMAGMPMGTGMLCGMALIVGGIAAALYGLRPKDASSEAATLPRADCRPGGRAADRLALDRRRRARDGPGGRHDEDQQPGIRDPGDAGRVRDHPGRRRAPAPLALTGATVGSFVWGALADQYGRRATILLSGVMFIGTSICGAMPSFHWNLVMCFLMGGSAGGMLPVAYALLAEIMPTRHRGWSLVLIGGAGTLGGYLVASGMSALLQPVFGWRIMWFLNLPSGLLLIALSPLIPESARFLLHIGRPQEARDTLARFGSVVVSETEDWDDEAKLDHSHLPPTDARYLGTTIALSMTALSWGLLSYGVLLWLPGQLIAEGHDMGVAAAIIARSTFISVPVIVIAALLYSRWSTKGALLVMIGISAAGLLALVLRESGVHAAADPVIALTLLIVGSTGVISIILPYTAESYPIRIRGRATGWVAGVSKSGGLVCQGLGSLALVPAIGTAALETAVPVALGLALLSLYGQETRGRDLRELERSHATSA